MAKSKKSPDKSKKKPAVSTSTKLAMAARTARKVVRASRLAYAKAKQAPAAAKSAMAKVKTEAQAAGHFAEVAAGQATKVIATTAGVVAGIVESVSHRDTPPTAAEPASKPSRSKKKTKSIATDEKSDGHG